jgi:hypothetical protein
MDRPQTKLGFPFLAAPLLESDTVAAMLSKVFYGRLLRSFGGESPPAASNAVLARPQGSLRWFNTYGGSTALRRASVLPWR